MVPKDLTPHAIDLVRKAAAKHDVGPDDVFKGWPRTPEENAARRSVITTLANEKLDDAYRYPIAKLMTWFSVSRATINRQRKKSGREYGRRKVRAA